MSHKDRYTPRPTPETKTVPFDTAAEAWFWFILAQQARNDGARFTTGLGLLPRPCEPGDILTILNTLYRGRRLKMEHLLVLRHYGRRQLPPDPRRAREMRAHTLWKEAFGIIEPALVRRGIVKAIPMVVPTPHKFWSHNAVVYEGAMHV